MHYNNSYLLVVALLPGLFAKPVPKLRLIYKWIHSEIYWTNNNAQLRRSHCWKKTTTHS